MARLAKTYGLRAFYVVTPVEEQQAFASHILDHWLKGWGSEYNKDRVEALELIRIKPSIEAAKAESRDFFGTDPLILATGANKRGLTLGFDEARQLLKKDKPLFILFGTAWGLAGESMEEADYLLPPIEGTTDYNHLSVRTAAAIIIDRLLGHRSKEA